MLSEIKNFYDEFSMTKKRIDNMIPVIEIVKDGEIKLTNGEESMVLPFSVVLQAAELIQDSCTIKKAEKEKDQWFSVIKERLKISKQIDELIQTRKKAAKKKKKWIFR